MKIWILIISIFTTAATSSSELTPAERMFNAMGIEQILSQAKKAQEEASKEQVKMVMAQLGDTFKKLPPEAIPEIEKLMNNMMDTVLNSWTVEEAIRVYSSAWNEHYSKEEIMAVVETYEKPEAQEELQMVLHASAQLNEFINSSYNSAIEKAMGEFIQDMQIIVRESLQKKSE